MLWWGEETELSQMPSEELAPCCLVEVRLVKVVLKGVPKGTFVIVASRKYHRDHNESRERLGRSSEVAYCPEISQQRAEIFFADWNLTNEPLWELYLKRNLAPIGAIKALALH
jgi:hypothetical protein